MAIPPSPGIIFQPFRLVSRTWNKLALPFIVRWWSRASPERILDFVKRHDVGSAVRHINIKTWTEIEHDPDIPLREDLWRETIVRCDSLESITIRIDRLERDEARDEAAGPGTKTWRWQQFLVDLFRNTMTVQQRRRVRKLNLQFHVDLVAVSVGLLADFATALPEVTTLIVQGYGTLPHQPGQVTIGLSSERTPPPTAMPAADQLRLTRLWTKVQHMVLLHIYSPWFNQVVTADNLMDWPGHSALSSLVQSSASALRSVEIDHVHHNNPPFGGCAVSAMFGIHDFEDALKNIRTSNHGQVLDDAQSVPPGHTLYPNLKAFTHRRCKPPLKQPTLFDYMPALEKLALEVRDVQNRSPVPEHWVECMPFQLTHLSLEFDNLNGWPDALMNLVSDRADSVGHERSNLKYLAIEPMAPNPEFAMLEGFVTTLLHRAMPHVLDDGQPGDLDLDDLRAIANVCERAGVFFACSDERLLVGDFWDGACHSDTVGDESEAMQVDGVDKVESGDGDDSSLDDDESSIDYEEDIGDVDVEDDYCWFEWWSDAKKRRMATGECKESVTDVDRSAITDMALSTW